MCPPWLSVFFQANSGYVRQIAGFNVTEIIVAGAGHMVPMNQPMAALGMIGRLVSGKWA